jgi:hypothetical protein
LTGLLEHYEKVQCEKRQKKQKPQKKQQCPLKQLSEQWVMDNGRSDWLTGGCQNLPGKAGGTLEAVS